MIKTIKAKYAEGLFTCLCMYDRRLGLYFLAEYFFVMGF
jgi:hypothetical protein